MILLLDTHTFIWSFNAPEKLSVRVCELLEDPENTLYLSIVSILEMQIKIQLGKLKLALGLPEIIEVQQKKNRVQILALELGHVYKLNDLPPHHKDPFDRLLLAQAQHEGAVLVSCDGAFAPYGVPLMW